MPAVKKNLLIEKGATFTLSLTWKDARGRPINLTGYSAVMEIRNQYGGTSLLTLSTANGKIVLGGALGTIKATIEDQDTAALTFESGGLHAQANGSTAVTFYSTVPAGCDASAWRLGPNPSTETKYSLLRDVDCTTNGGEGLVLHDGLYCVDNAIIGCKSAPALSGNASALDIQPNFSGTLVAYSDFDASNSGYLCNDDADILKWWTNANRPDGRSFNYGRHTWLANKLTVGDGKSANALCFSRSQYTNWIGNVFKRVGPGGGLANSSTAILSIGLMAQYNKLLFNTFDLRNMNRMVLNAGYTTFDEVGIAQQFIEFKGNIVILTGNPTADVPIMKVRSSDIGTWDIDYNCYWYDKADGLAFWTEAGTTGDGTDTKLSLSAWKALSGAPDEKSLNQNPQLTVDSQLPFGSPLVGAGPSNAVCYLLSNGPAWYKGSASIGAHEPR